MRPQFRRLRVFTVFAVLVAFGSQLAPPACDASIVTTTFANNNGQAGNQFDINVLTQGGLNIEAFDLNLDAGNWDVQLYTRVGSHVGFESNAGAWTLHDEITGLTSAGEGNPTFWDFEDLTVGSGINAFYVVVTNGPALNYTNGTGLGNVIVDNGNLQILEGTGNAGLFGFQFQPRIWNGSIHFSTVAVPEPRSIAMLVLFTASLMFRRKRIL